jgi:amphi-Trp domain-containing protein
MSSSDVTLLKTKVQTSRIELAETLEVIAGQIRRGALDTSDWIASDHPVDREIPEQVHLAVEIKDSPKTDGTKRELELEIWWLT